MEWAAGDDGASLSSAEIVSDAYFPPDVDETVQRLERQAQQQRRERADALALARAHFSTSSRWGGAEAYVYSDDAVRDLQHVRWLPIPSAAARRRRWRLMNCMRELRAPVPVTITDGVGPTSSAAGPSPADGITESASDAAASTGAGSPPEAAASSASTSAAAATDAAPAGHSDVDAAPSHRTAAPHRRSFTSDQFSADCWQLLDDVSTAAESEHWALYTAAATLSLLQRQAQGWAASGLLWTAQRSGMNATRLLAAVSVAVPRDEAAGAALRGVPVGAASTGLYPFLLGLLSMVRLLPLAVLALARRAARLGARGVAYLLGGGAASYQPAADSMVGALATNDVWRLQVEVMLVGTALVVLAACVLVVVRYRKYTRTVEHWEAEMLQRYAADVARWEAHVQARRRGVRTPTTPSSISLGEPARGGVGLGGRTGSRTKPQPSPPPSRPASLRSESLADMLRAATCGTPHAVHREASSLYLEESKTPTGADAVADAAFTAPLHRLPALGESLLSGGDDSVVLQLSGEQLPMQGSFREAGASGPHRASASPSTVGAARPAAVRPNTFLVSSTTSAPTRAVLGARGGGSSSSSDALHAGAPPPAEEGVGEGEAEGGGDAAAVDKETLRRLASPLAEVERRAPPTHDTLSRRAFSWMDTVPLQVPGLGTRAGTRATAAPASDSATPRNGRSAERVPPTLFSVSAFVGQGGGGGGAGAAATLPRPDVSAAAGAPQRPVALPTDTAAASTSDVSELAHSSAVASNADDSDTGDASPRGVHDRTLRPRPRRSTGQFEGGHADALVSLIRGDDADNNSPNAEDTPSRASRNGEKEVH